MFILIRKVTLPHKVTCILGKKTGEDREKPLQHGQELAASLINITDYIPILGMELERACTHLA